MTNARVEPASGSKEAAKKLDFLASLKLVSRFSDGSRLKLAAAILVATSSVVFELLPIWVVYRLVEAVIAGTANLKIFLLYAAIAGVSVFLGVALMGLALGLSHIVAFNLLFKMRMAIARHMAKLPLGFFSNRRSGDAKKLMIDDPEQLELVVAHGLPEGISALATWLAVSLWLFVVDWRMAIAAVFLTPVSFVLMGINMAAASKWIAQFQKANTRMNASIVEFLAGMPVVKVFNRTGQSYAETSQAVREFAAIQTKWGEEFVLFGGAFYVLVVANVVLILPVGVWLLAKGEIDLSTMLFFVVLGANYSQPLMKLFNQFHTFAHISISSMLVADVLNSEPQPDTDAYVSLPNYDISFENVRFSYGQNEVLHDVSFLARTGDVTALVGPSGSGKSTIASLIPRFWDVQSGVIRIGGVDIRDIGLDQLMDNVSFVFQDTFLFSDTIATNIRFGNPDATDAEVEAAARGARAHDFIIALPQGYDTQLNEQGRSLSGGERQRLAIARAILKNAPIIVLDEATAFADPDNEAAIQEAIGALTRGKTLIMIAHRLHTISSADQILVVDKGEICERGVHETLVAHEGVYAQLWRDYTEAGAITFHTQNAKNARGAAQ